MKKQRREVNSVYVCAFVKANLIWVFTINFNPKSVVSKKAFQEIFYFSTNSLYAFLFRQMTFFDSAVTRWCSKWRSASMVLCPALKATWLLLIRVSWFLKPNHMIRLVIIFFKSSLTHNSGDSGRKLFILSKGFWLHSNNIGIIPVLRAKYCTKKFE